MLPDVLYYETYIFQLISSHPVAFGRNTMSKDKQPSPLLSNKIYVSTDTDGDSLGADNQFSIKRYFLQI